jgi:hypothetical protein
VDAEQRPYLAHLSRRDIDSLPSDADAVAELLASPGWRVVNELLDEVHEQAVTRLLFGHAGSDGRVLDQAEYARLLGFLSGLRQTRWAAQAFLTHAERAQTKENR